MKLNDNQLSSLVAELQEKKVLKLVEQYIARGFNPLDIMEQCNNGMIQIGKYYEDGRYYISGLIMAGEIMRRVGQMVLPLIESKEIEGVAGNIVLGTIEGDIHSVGKDIFKVLAQIFGFTVHDLGVDVSVNRFFTAVNEFRPDIVGFSCLLTAVYDTMREAITFLKKNIGGDISPRAYIIGGRVNKLVCETVGGDYWINDAMNGVRLCQKVMEADA